MFVIISRQVKEITKYTIKHFQQLNLIYLLVFSLSTQSMAAFYASLILNILHHGIQQMRTMN